MASIVDIQVPESLSNQLTQRDTYYFGELTMTGSPNSGGLAGQGTTGFTTGLIKPCEWHFWRFSAESAFGPADWLNLNATQRDAQRNEDNSERIHAGLKIPMYIKWTDSATAWSGLPSETDFMWKINVAGSRGGDANNPGNDHFMEVRPCDLKSTGFYWVAFQGPAQHTEGGDWEGEPYTIEYSFSVNWRRALGECRNGNCQPEPITPLTLGTALTVFNDTRPPPGEFGDEGNQLAQDRVRDWRYFSVNIPMATSYAEGSFLVVNISHVLSDSNDPSHTFANVRLATNFGSVPWYTNNANDLAQVDPNGQTPSDKQCAMSTCYQRKAELFPAGAVADCQCTPNDPDSNVCELNTVNPPDVVGVAGDRQATCNLLINPCSFRYDVALDGTTGTNYYIGVKLPRSTEFDDGDVYFRNTNYTVLAYVRSPVVTSVPSLPAVIDGHANFPNVDDELIMFTRWSHYKVVLAEESVSANTNMLVRLADVQGGQTNVYVRQGTASPGTDLPDLQLAGPGRDIAPCNCYSNMEWSCEACDTCSVVVHKCWLTAGTYYIAVEPEFGEVPASLTAPTDYHLEVSLYDDPLPTNLVAGVPQHGVLEERHYDFYVLDVPKLDDTWLYIELFADATDAELTLQALYGDQPGETCFAQGDFFCRTSAAHTRNAANNGNQESCYFAIDACHLQEGPLYLSVYGVPNQVYGHKVHYTLWAEFETAWQITNNVTYTDTVRLDHYNHYFLRVDDAATGSWLTVETDNIQWQGTEGNAELNTFINYGSLAGQCPCYDSMYNCSGNIDPAPCNAPDQCTYNYLPAEYNLEEAKYTPVVKPYQIGTNAGCCKLYVDGCSFGPGTWYIGVQGYIRDTFNPEEVTDTFKSTAIGYTLTAIVHPPPPVFELALNQPLVDWVKDEQHNHYRLLATPIDGENLVVRVTFMQDNCGRYIPNQAALQNGQDSSWQWPGAHFLGGVENANAIPPTVESDNGDWIELRLGGGRMALMECYDEPWSCKALRDNWSSCTLIVPSCKWQAMAQPLYVSTRLVLTDERNPRGDTTAQFTLEAHLESEPVAALVPGVATYGSLREARYNHYTLEVDTTVPQRLDVDLYYNADRSYYATAGQTGNVRQSSPHFAMNKDSLAGVSRGKCADCINKALIECTDAFSCHWSFDPCDLAEWGSGTYYFSVFSAYGDFYDLPLEYTLKASFVDPVVTVQEGSAARFSDSVWPSYGQGNDFNNFVIADKYVPYHQRHYKFALEAVAPGDYLTLRVANVRNGNLRVYYQKDGLAGRCPCYDHEYFLDCGSAACDGGSCELTVPPCELSVGTFYLNVVGLDSTLNVASHTRQIDYQIEVLLNKAEVKGPNTPTNTEAGGSAFFLGWSGVRGNSPSDKWLWPISEDDVDDYIDWNPSNSFDGNKADNGEYVHFSFSVSDPTNQVYFLLDNVVGERCHWDSDPAHDPNPTTVTLYFNGQSGPDIPNSGDKLAEQRNGNNCAACSRVITTLAVNQPGGSQAYGIIPPCLLSEAGTYYLTARVNSETDYRSNAGTNWEKSHFNYEYGYNPVTFDLKVFLQAPIPIVRDQFFNVSHVFNTPQRFVISDMNTAGTAPMSRIIFRDLHIAPFVRLAISVRPDAPAGWKTCGQQTAVNSVSGPCLDSACLEVRGGVPLTNTEVFEDGEIPGSIMSFNFECAGECHVNLLPCALKGGNTQRWFVTVNLVAAGKQDSDATLSAGSPPTNGHWPYYEVTYQNLGDRAASRTIDFPTSFIESRLRWPGTEDASDEGSQKLSGYEDMVFWRIPVTGIDKSSRDDAVDNSNYRRLEIQTYFVNADDEGDCCSPATITQAPIVVYIAKGEPDASSDDAVIQQHGLPPVRPLTDTASWDGAVAKDTTTCDACSQRTYICGTFSKGGVCSTETDRFFVPSCCLTDGTYWVVARLLAPGKRAVQLRVRMVEQKGANPAAEGALVRRIPAADLPRTEVTPSNPFTIVALTETSGGVEPQNYHHYVLGLTDSDIVDSSQTPALTRSLFFNFTINDATTGVTRAGGDLYLFVQRGARAGLPANVAGAHAYGQTVNKQADCLSWTYSCKLSGNNFDRCVIDIPYCQLSAGDWYFSVYADEWYADVNDGLYDPNDAGENQFKNYLGYELALYLRPEASAGAERVAVVPAENTAVCWDLTQSGDAPLTALPFTATGPEIGGAFVHHVFSVSNDVLNGECGGAAGCIYEKWMDISVRNYVVDNAIQDDETFFTVYMQTPQTITIDDVAQHLEGPAGFGWQNAVSNQGKFPTNQASQSYCLSSNWLLSYTNQGTPVYQTQVPLQADREPTSNLNAVWPKRIYPCPRDRREPALTAGNYYISIYSQVRVDYQICAGIVHPNYERLTGSSPVESSLTNGETATVEVASLSWRYDSDGTSNNEDDHDRYVTFEVSPSDQTRYLQFNWTNLYCDPDSSCSSGEASIKDALDKGRLSLEVWRDDCMRWDCGRPTEPRRPTNDNEVATVVETQPSYGGCSALKVLGVDEDRDDDNDLGPDDANFGAWNSVYRLVVDSMGLAPCSLEGGRYFMRIKNDDEYDYDLRVRLRAGQSAQLTEAVPMVSTIATYQYHFYSIDVTNVGYGAALYATLTETGCGQVEMFAKRGTPAGPRAPHTNIGSTMVGGFTTEPTPDLLMSVPAPTQDDPDFPVPTELGCEKCASAYCRTAMTNIMDVPDDGSCAIFIDSCELLPDHSDSTTQVTWYFTVHGLQQEQDVSNTLIQPVSYTITASLQRINTIEDNSFGCKHTLPTYDDLSGGFVCGATAQPAVIGVNLPPQQFVFDVETVSDLARLRVSLTRDNADPAYLVVSRNVSVPFTYDNTQAQRINEDYVQASCQLDAKDVIKLDLTANNNEREANQVIEDMDTCTHGKVGPSRLFGWLQGTQGITHVYVERWEPYVPIILPRVVYSGSINQPDAEVTITPAINAPYRPEYQHYRFPTLDTAATHFGFTLNMQWVRNGDIEVTIQKPGTTPQPTLACANNGAAGLTANFPAAETYPQHVLFDRCQMTRSPFYLTVRGLNQKCAATCEAVTYAFSYTIGVEVKSVPCNVPFCDTVKEEPAWGGAKIAAETVNRYVLSESSATVNRVADGQFEYPYTSLLLEDYDDTQDKLAAQFAFTRATDRYACTSGNDADMCDGTQLLEYSSEYLAPNFCPYTTQYFSVQALTNNANDDEYRFKLTPTCASVTVTDVTSLIAAQPNGWSIDGSALSCTGTVARDYYSFEVALDDIAVRYLHTMLWRETDASTVTSNLYVGSLCGSVQTCNLNAGTTQSCKYACSLANTVYYMTVDHDGPYKLQAVLRGPESGFPNTEVTVGETSNSISFASVSDNADQLVWFEVTEEQLGGHADNYITVELRDVSHTGNNVLTAYVNYGSQPYSGCRCDEATVSNNPRTTNYDDQTTTQTLVMDHCTVRAGRYYVRLVSNIDACEADALRLRVRVSIERYGIAAPQLTHDSVVSHSLNTRNYHSEFKFYTINTEVGDRGQGQVRLANVQGGALELLVQSGALPGSFNNANAGFNEFNIDDATNTYDSIASFGPYHDRATSQSCGCGAVWRCSTIPPYTGSSVEVPSKLPGTGYSPLFDPFFSPVNTGCGSCAIAIDACSWSTGSYYAAVRVLVQEDPNTAVTYDIVYTQFNDFTELAYNTASDVVTFTSALSVSPRAVAANGNWEHKFYSLSTQGAFTSLVIEVEVGGSDGFSSSRALDGVYVSVYDDVCSGSSRIFQNYWCAAEYESWVCEFEIPTRAMHSGATEWYIDVYGKQGSFSLKYRTGLDNCVDPSSALSFCSGYVDYPVWQWNNLNQLDNEASCLYNDLQWRFDNPDLSTGGCTNIFCQNGTTWACKESLRQFACSEVFKKCDADGFYVGTCTDLCSTVEQECARTFASVDLEHYACTSSRYIDPATGTCSGTGDSGVPVGHNSGSSLGVTSLIAILSLAILSLVASFN